MALERLKRSYGTFRATRVGRRPERRARGATPRAPIFMPWAPSHTHPDAGNPRRPGQRRWRPQKPPGSPFATPAPAPGSAA
ncbi:MAG: hypothetical protein E6I31_02165 [Chloroflexi bacterium]|nr:MAG: hypothetical protein E6I31_02165 [Chloroflexota bacterium]